MRQANCASSRSVLWSHWAVPGTQLVTSHHRAAAKGSSRGLALVGTAESKTGAVAWSQGKDRMGTCRLHSFLRRRTSLGQQLPLPDSPLLPPPRDRRKAVLCWSSTSRSKWGALPNWMATRTSPTPDRFRIQGYVPQHKAAPLWPRRSSSSSVRLPGGTCAEVTPGATQLQRPNAPRGQPPTPQVWKTHPRLHCQGLP